MPDYITIVCKECNKPFKFIIGSRMGPRPKLCGDACKKSANDKSMQRSLEKSEDRTCKYCENIFKFRFRNNDGTRGQFCSKDCLGKYKTEHGLHHKGNCRHCGKSTDLVSNRMFCNVQCKKLFIITNEEYCNIEKICNACGKSKRLYDFQFRENNEIMSFTNECSNCHSKKSNIRRTKEDARNNFFITRWKIRKEDFIKILESQNYSCPICKKTQQEIEGEGRKGPAAIWQIDHNHKTNDIRGCLCHPCNVGLGRFKDETSILLNAVEYIIRDNKEEDLQCLIKRMEELTVLAMYLMESRRQ